MQSRPHKSDEGIDEPMKQITLSHLLPLLGLLGALGALVAWFIGFLFQADFRVRSTRKDKFRKLLAVFPHPDDEVLTCSGLLGERATEGLDSVLVILTRGERGTPTGEPDLMLKDIRSGEAQSVASLLGVTRIDLADFGDGAVRANRNELLEYLENLLRVDKPDLVITYDLAGLYGHDDHMACSEAITELVRTQFPDVHLWYATQPSRIRKMARLPEHMAKDPNFARLRAVPTLKVFIGRSIIKKIRALYRYRSQRQSFRDGFPFKSLPLWLLASTLMHEYFCEAN